MNDETSKQNPEDFPQDSAPPLLAVTPSAAAAPTPRDNRTLWIVLAIAALLALLCCCLAIASWGLMRNALGQFNANFDLDNPVSGPAATYEFEDVQSVAGGSRMTVDLPFGDVRIESGNAGQVAIRGQVTLPAADDQAQLRQRLTPTIVAAEGDVVTVRNDWQDQFVPNAGRAKLEVTIFVPPTSALTVEMGAGRLVIEGTEGDLVVNVGAGDIQLRNKTVSQALRVQTGAGRIVFEGALTPNAAYNLLTGAGEVLVSLPAGSEFRLNASSGLGAVECDFELNGGGSQKGRALQGEVGANPTATLDLQSSVGQVVIRRLP